MGNIIGCLLIDAVARYTGMFTAGAAEMAVHTVQKTLGSKKGRRVWLKTRGTPLGVVFFKWFPCEPSLKQRTPEKETHTHTYTLLLLHTNTLR